MINEHINIILEALNDYSKWFENNSGGLDDLKLNEIKEAKIFINNLYVNSTINFKEEL